ncbi:hypothetical protein OH492_09090 [Vibrio chagasii]|nr:hypothetical protein [Vibrio chagasii]
MRSYEPSSIKTKAARSRGLGSKPELLAVLALAQKQDSVIVCNGYKDRIPSVLL